MSTTASRILKIGIPFLLLGALGTYLYYFYLVLPCKIGTTSVLVGPAASDVTPECVKLRKTDRIYWMATDAGKDLYIEFTERPFTTMTNNPDGNGRYRVACVRSTCAGGAFNPAAQEKEYKYWQVLVDPNNTNNKEEADGRMIIIR